MLMTLMLFMNVYDSSVSIDVYIYIYVCLYLYSYTFKIIDMYALCRDV